jgi:hypothetical protein
MLTSHELLGFMSPALALEIITYTFDSDKPLYRATLAAVAEARKVRPVFLEKKARTERHQLMIATLARPALEMVTANLLRTWLLKKHASMLGDFLDSLSIPHKEGVVDELPSSIEEPQLRPAIDALLAKYPPEVVATYLNAFTEMNEVEWPAMKTMLETDKRLQLGG